MAPVMKKRTKNFIVYAHKPTPNRTDFVSSLFLSTQASRHGNFMRNADTAVTASPGIGTCCKGTDIIDVLPVSSPKPGFLPLSCPLQRCHRVHLEEKPGIACGEMASFYSLVPVIVVVLTKGEKQRLLFSPAALSSHSTWPHLSFGPMLMIIFKDNRVIIIRKRIGDWGGGWHSAKAPKIMQMFSSPAEPCYPSRKQKICCSLGYSGITSSALSPSSALFDSTDWLCWLCTSIQGLLPYSWVHSFVLFP